MVKVPVRSHYRVNSGGALAGARQGIGYAILAAGPCQEDLAAGRLVEVPLELRPAPLQLLAVYGHRHSASARVYGPCWTWIKLRLDEMTPARPSARQRPRAGIARMGRRGSPRKWRLDPELQSGPGKRLLHRRDLVCQAL